MPRILFQASLQGETPRARGQVLPGLTRARAPRPVLPPGRAGAGLTFQGRLFP